MFTLGVNTRIDGFSGKNHNNRRLEWDTIRLVHQIDRFTQIVNTKRLSYPEVATLRKI